MQQDTAETNGAAEVSAEFSPYARAAFLPAVTGELHYLGRYRRNKQDTSFKFINTKMDVFLQLMPDRFKSIPTHMVSVHTPW